jgi:hypothetical protein
MSYKVLRERIGKELTQISASDGSPAKVFYACRVNGFVEGRQIDLEYVNDAQGLTHVMLIRRNSSGRRKDVGCWSLEAIKNRDAKGLEGFIEFAKGLGIAGHQLAHIAANNFREPS